MKSLTQLQDRTELMSRLGKLTPQSERRWGRMTAPQMVCHVGDACRMALGQKPVSDDTGILKQTMVKWMALYAPFRWRPGILTRPEIDQQLAGTCPGDFASDVADLRALLVTIATREPGTTWPDHPVFGKMSSSQWLRWAYLHTDHHLRQFGV